ncbi:MAG: nucleoside-diphosphate kinase [Thermoplasmata archaeon]
MPEAGVERTLVLVKPDGVRRGLMGTVVSRLEAKGFTIVAARLLRVSPATAEVHYAEHRGKPFYPDLVAFITSAPVLALAVQGRGAIAAVRALIGATNPLSAAPGTVRGDLGLAVTSNLVHASDSPASASRELSLFFRPEEFAEYTRCDAEYL